MFLKKIIREPLIQFLLLGGVIFAAYNLASVEDWATDRIIVSSAKIAQMNEVFFKTWQRPPSADDLKAMIDDYVKEELYVRQALALGLDQDDTVIRRRLRQKMEFIGNAEAESLVPTDAELQVYLDAHPQSFEVDPSIAVEQVFINAQSHGSDIEAYAAGLLSSLNARPDADISALGDTTLLPSSLPLQKLGSVIETFGPEFAEAARKADTGRWFGPVRSGYGFHLIRVTEREAGRVPKLTEIHDAVRVEWLQSKRHEIEDKWLAELLRRYEVVIEATDKASGAGP